MSQLEPELPELKSGARPGVEELQPGLTKLAERKRLHDLLNVLPAAIYITDGAGRITYFNEAAAALWGCRPKLNTDQGHSSWRLYRPDGTPMPHDQSPMAVTLRGRRPSHGQAAIAERPDGSRVPFMAFATPLTDSFGALIGAVNMLIDLSTQKPAFEMSRRLAAIVESCDDAIVSKDLNGVITTWNKGAERLFGYMEHEIIGKPVTTLIPEDRQDEEKHILERIRRGDRIEHFETIRRRKDGGLIAISLSVSPVSDETGRIVGASKIARDITEQKRKEEQIALLAREADHRTKNLMALAQATVHLTHAETPEQLKSAIEGRLRALANAHAALAQSRWAGADLHHLVKEELSPYCHEDDPRVTFSGPSVMLEQEPAQAMALTVHELATNAVKHGALSGPNGRVSVEWRLRPLREISFRWSEMNGPAVKPPTRNGFGKLVIERMICGQLNGELNFDWREDGLVCDLVLPR